jgi:quercetin dioxygenase-like cupin family protein
MNNSYLMKTIGVWSTIVLCFLSIFLANVVQAENLLPGWKPALSKEKTNEAWNGEKLTAYPQGKPEISVYHVTIPANTALPWHKHPVPCVAYVLSGTFQVEMKDGKKSRLYHGNSNNYKDRALVEVMNEWHRGIAVGNQDVECIMFFAGAPGFPPVIELKDEATQKAKL